MIKKIAINPDWFYHRIQLEKLEDISVVEKQPKLEGRNMFTILAKKA